MLNTSGVALLSMFLLLGAGLAWAMSSDTGTLVALFGAATLVAALALPTAIAKLTRSLRSVFRGITWWQVLWALMFLSGLVFRDRGYEAAETEPLDSWALIRIALMCATAVLLLTHLAFARRQWLVHMFRGLTGVLAAYCLLSLISSAWSVYPSWTAYKSLEMGVDVAMVAAVVSSATGSGSYKRLFDWTWMLEGLLLASVWVGAVAKPSEALLPSSGLLSFQLFGVMPNVHANTIGEIGAVLGVVAFTRILLRQSRSERVMYGFVLLWALTSMALAQARSGILGFVVGVFCILLFSGRRLLASLLSIGGFTVFSIQALSQTVTAYMRRGETETELTTLSSRVEWWSYAWPKFLEHPFSGYGGFAASRFFVMAEYRVDVAGIHSEWVETAVGTGIGGVLLVLGVLVATWRYIVASIRSLSPHRAEYALALEASGVLAVLTVRSIFSSSLVWHPPILFFTIVAFAEHLRLARQASAARVVTFERYAPANAAV